MPSVMALTSNRSNVKKIRSVDIHEYFEAILPCFNGIEDVVHGLSKAGLRRPMEFWSCLSVEARTFESELIKESHCSFKLKIEDVVHEFGYKSALVDEILLSVGLDREGLGLLSHSEGKDELIRQSSYLSSYTRESLLRERSGTLEDHFRKNNLEISDIGISEVSEYIGLRTFDLEQKSVTKHEISALLDQAFVGLGYRSANPKSGEYARDYMSSDDNQLFKFTTKIDNTFGRYMPYSIDIFIRPSVELTCDINGHLRSFEKNGPHSFLWTIAPAFGGYRASLDLKGLLFTIYAYKHLIELLPSRI